MMNKIFLFLVIAVGVACGQNRIVRTNDLDSALTAYNDTVTAIVTVELAGASIGDSDSLGGVVSTDYLEWSDTAGVIATQYDLSQLSITSVNDTTTALRTDVNANTSNIATNTSNIATNTSGVSDNTDSITALRTDVNTNTVNISDNSDSLTTIRTDVNTNIDSVTALRTDINTNSTYINTNNTVVNDSLTAIRTGVTTNTGNIATNSTNITINSDSVTAIRTDVNTNTGNISTNTANITVNSDSITAIRTDVNTNTGNISTNTGNISSNSDSVTALRTDVNNNTGDISTLSSTVSALTSTTNNIGTLNSGYIIVGNGSNLATDVDPTGDVEISNTGVTAISANTIVNADINSSAGIDASKIADGTVSSTEFQYINSLSSNAQTQITTNSTDIDALETLASGYFYQGNGSNVATEVQITGDVVVGTSGNASIQTGVIVDGMVGSSANIDVSKLGTGIISNTEFNYLNDVNANIQDQLDIRPVSWDWTIIYPQSGEEIPLKKVPFNTTIDSITAVIITNGAGTDNITFNLNHSGNTVFSSNVTADSYETSVANIDSWDLFTTFDDNTVTKNSYLAVTFGVLTGTIESITITAHCTETE